MSSLLKNLVRHPRRTGAIAPSSPHLARLMGACASSAEHVIELGAGTGALTTELIAQFGPDKVTAFEIDGKLADALRENFPGLDVRSDCALSALKDASLAKPRTAVVSSLPFRSLPEPFTESFREAVKTFLCSHAGSVLVQFTYGKKEPFRAPVDCHWTRVGTVLLNLPPATVWVLRAQQ